MTIKPIDLFSLLGTDWPEENFIEGGLFSRGDTLIIGAESKAGKSTLVFTLLRQLMTGGSFLGFKVLKPLSVLLMQAEIREPKLKSRLINTYGSVDKDVLSRSYAWNTRGAILIENDIEEIKSNLKELKPDILVIDPLINFHTYDENNASQMSNLFRRLDLLKSEFNLSVIMSQHFRKVSAGAKTNEALLERIRGTSALRGWADTTIVMEGRTQSGYRHLEFELRNSDTIFRRVVKYNDKTKEFDWYDPVYLTYKILSDEMNGEALNTNQTITLILSKCGHLVSKNRTKAFDMKDILIEQGFLKSRKEGKNILLEISDEIR